MAGRRRQHQVPTQRETRKERRRARMAVRYAAAATPAERLAVACDYVRGAAARRQPDPAWAGQLLDDLAHQLLAAGDRLLERQGRESKCKRVQEVAA